MLYVNEKGVIRLTRGDTASLSVSINNQTTGELFKLSGSDTLRLTVKKSVHDTDPLFQKVVNGINTIQINPADTKSLSFGKYVYDVELTTSMGDVYTVIVPTVFEILQEVS